MSFLLALRGVKRFLVHRTTVLCLLVASAGAVLLSLVWPGDERSWDGPALEHAPTLDRILTSLPFVLLLAAFLISLVLSTWDQLQLARRRLREPGAPTDERLLPGLDEPAADRVMRSLGYRRLARRPDGAVYVRQGWAAWGSVLLHAGMALALASFLHYVATERQGVLRLAEGDAVNPDEPWTAETGGLLASPLHRTDTVRLTRVEPTFGSDDSLASLTARFDLVGPDGRVDPHQVSPNESHYHWGLRIYQLASTGHVFELTATAGALGPTPVSLPLPLPRSRDQAGYGTFKVAPFPGTLKAKYHLSEGRDSMSDEAPLLTLRLVDGKRVLDEAALRPGETARLGGVTVRLDGVRRFTTLLFDAGVGMGPVLLGFLVMAAGALMVYAGVARTVTLRRAPGGLALGWRVLSRSERLFRTERDALLERCLEASRS